MLYIIERRRKEKIDVNIIKHIAYHVIKLKPQFSSLSDAESRKS